ncbi:MAG: hypothetical protein ACTSV7_06700 [Candidatus Baldrarchaeia archaeon]
MDREYIIGKAKFSLSERYRLELHWEKAIYEQEGICKLVNAYFIGPALSIAEKINDNDFLFVDFYKQYYIIVENVYVAKLSWGEVVYNEDSTVASLKNAYLTHDTELNKAPTFKNTDYIIMDTSDHEMAVHGFNLFYASYVVDEHGILYNF